MWNLSRLRSEFRRAGLRCSLVIGLIAVLFAATAANAQPASEPAPGAAQPAAPTTDPASDKATVPNEPASATSAAPLEAEVTAVSGSVHRAAAGVSALAEEGWTPVLVGDRLAAGTQIRTGRRSSVDLRFGESTYINISTPTYANIEQFHRTATAVEAIRIGLGYGRIRGGSFGGAAHSDVVIDAPSATLAKRGTDGWEISVEPGTGRFTIALAREGLVEAIQRIRAERAESRLVRPGEYATESNIAGLWVRQAVFDRNVTYHRASWITAADASWSAEQTGGMNVVAPGLGAAGWSYAAPGYATWARQQLDARSGRNTRPTLQLPTRGAIERPEGNFGTRP